MLGCAAISFLDFDCQVTSRLSTMLTSGTTAVVAPLLKGVVMRCLWVFVLAAACAGSSGPADQRQCARLREHVVDLQLADVHVAVGIDREAHRRALKQSLGDNFVANCSSTLTEDQVDCVLNASDRAAIAACTR